MARLSVSMAFYVILFILNLSDLLWLSHSSTCVQENQTALFIFGDSLFDVGNNNYINTTTFLQANFFPYGETFFKYPTGRFSNGRVIPDFIAEYAKLPLIPPYLHPGYHNHDQYIYGVNFASAGAGALVETNQGLALNLKTQANNFIEVSKQLRQQLGIVEAKKLLSRSVYIFSIGGNDYGTPFLTNSSVVLPYPQQEFVDSVIGNITTAIKVIYNEGGKNFGFVNVGPLNCFPYLRRFVNRTALNACLNEEASTLARLHNSALSKTLEKLGKQLKGFKYSVSDFYNALTELMKYPSKYGFKEGNGACCGGGEYRGDYSCGGKRGIKEYELCDNVNEHVFFDALHPTEKVAEYLAKLMWNGNSSHYFIKSYA